MSSSQKLSHQQSSGSVGQMVPHRLSPSLIDLEHLSPEERGIILSVLERDEQLRQSDQERVKRRARKLKNELHDLRKKGALKSTDENDNSRVCMRCREPLGLLFNSGDSCPKCQHKVCKACQVTLPSGTRWLCSVCHKNMQIQLETGEWYYSKLQVDQVPLFGSDLVKASLAKAKHSLTDPTTPPVLTASDLRSNSSSSSLQGKRRGEPGRGRQHKGRQGSRTSSDYTSSNARDSSQRSVRYENNSSGPSSPVTSLKTSSRVSSSLTGTGNTSASEVYSEPEDYPRGGGKNKWTKATVFAQAGGRFYKRKGDGKSHSKLQKTRTHNRSYSSGSEPLSVTDSSEVEAVVEPISGFTFQRVSFRRDRKGSDKQDGSKDSTDQGRGNEEMGCVPCSEPEPSCVPTGLPEDDQDYYRKANGKPVVSNSQVDSKDAPVISVDVVDDNRERDDSEDEDIDRHFMVHGGLAPESRNKFGIQSDNSSQQDTESASGKGTAPQSSYEDSSSTDKPAPVEHSGNGRAVGLDSSRDPHLPTDGASSPESHALPGSYNSTKTNSLGGSRSRSSVSSLQRKLPSGSNLSKGSSVSMTSLYSQAGEENYGKYVITGDINFGLHYNYKTNVFEVKIKACRDLAPVDAKRIKSDPYVKTYLLPDKTKASKRKTFVRKGTVNPQYEMTLKYHISQSELETRTLSVTVWNNDAFGRNDFLGEVLVNMDSVNLDDYKPKWHQLGNKSQPAEGAVAYKGDLSLSLMYSDTAAPEVEEKDSKKKKKKDKAKKGGKTQPAEGQGVLYVKIREARNLVGVRLGGSSNPFVKGYLEPDRSKTGKHKTAVLRGTCNPVWDHVMKFENVSLSLLKERCLELTVWDHEALSSNEFLGGTRLNLGTGEYQRKPASWNDASGEEIKAWEQMLKNPSQWTDTTLVLRPSMVSRLQFT